MKESLVCKIFLIRHIQSQQMNKDWIMTMKHTLTQNEIDDGIKRAHELRSLAFFDALEALTSPFKANKKAPPFGTYRSA